VFKPIVVVINDQHEKPRSSPEDHSVRKVICTREAHGIVKDFFPAELQATLDPVKGKSRASTKVLSLARSVPVDVMDTTEDQPFPEPSAPKPSDVRQKFAIDEMEDEKDDDDARQEQIGEEEEEELDDDYEQDEEELAGDYAAEDYFNDGGDDQADDYGEDDGDNNWFS
jgi:DNA-directed RNA polymerase III subunit RPC7